LGAIPGERAVFDGSDDPRQQAKELVPLFRVERFQESFGGTIFISVGDAGDPEPSAS
jgi:hypothetical protein